MSRGEQTKLALTIALSMRPDLLLLDEPTSGLDPLVRRDFLDAIITLIEARECTVLFSTHILSDVERVADTVLIMNEGKLVETATLAQLQARYTRASFVFDLSPDDIELPGALSMQKGARELLATFADVSDADLKALAEQIGARDVARVPMALEDIFLQLIDPSEDSV
ncbi:MAG: ABC-2 type transport system ATP-binding protein [Rhodothermales bacterium]